MGNVVRIAKDGFNVLSTTAPDDLIFSSEYNTLKYYAAGSATVNYVDNGTTYSITVAHNLGYIPFFVAYTLQGGSATFYNIVPNNQGTLAGEFYGDVYADATNLYFKVRQNQGSGASASMKFYYKIFKNRLGL